MTHDVARSAATIHPEAAGWRRAMRRAAFSGAIASLFSTVALAVCGKIELDDPFAPVNGPSQWVLGRHAPYQNGFRLPHTVIGYAIHHAMSVLWAVLFEKWVESRRFPKPASALAASLLTSAGACTVDFRCTPQRFTPGFEKRLSRKALFVVYAAFAAGLAVGYIARRPDA